MKVLTPVLVLTLATVAPGLADAVPTPADFGKLFCEASLADDMSAIEAEMSPGLALVVAEAEAKNAQVQATFPDEKPPLGDGLPWRSYLDLADGCEVGAIEKGKRAETTTVEIHYAFKDFHEGDYFDRLVLLPSVNEPGSWELDDIEFMTNETMRTFLAGSFEAPPSN